ncbi:MAG: hypothetical protein ACI9W2_001599 [Gammaproteobacteria bacterium]|jgi:hypothetical protein
MSTCRSVRVACCVFAADDSAEPTRGSGVAVPASTEGGRCSVLARAQPAKGMTNLAGAKSFDVSKREMREAYKRVKANRGGVGADGVTISQFEQDLSKNLYRVWNRMASGSYFPPPLKRVSIPKGDGRTRPLGIPTVSDRIAQMVVKRRLAPYVVPTFHADSYG